MKYLLRGLAAGVAGGVVAVLMLGGVTSAHKGGVIPETICASTANPTTTGTVEEVLYTCAVPAGDLQTDGSGIKVECWGQSGPTGTINYLRTYFGATMVANRGTLSANTIISNYSTTLRKSATSQASHGISVSAAGDQQLIGAVVNQTNPTEDTAGVINVECRSQTTTAGNFTGKGFWVGYIPAPQ